MQSDFNLLVRQHDGPLRGYLRRMVKDKALADDLAQTTWMDAWRAQAQYAGRGPVRAWLFSIARHQAMDSLHSARRRRTQVFSEMACSGASVLVAPADEPGDDTDEKGANQRQHEDLLRGIGPIRDRIGRPEGRQVSAGRAVAATPWTADEVIHHVQTADAADYVEAEDGEVRVRQEVFDPGIVFSPSWSLEVDLFEVTITG